MAIDSRKKLATDLITEDDYKALDLVLNNPLRLSTKDFNLGEVISKVMVELSEVRHNSTHAKRDFIEKLSKILDLGIKVEIEE